MILAWLHWYLGVQLMVAVGWGFTEVIARRVESRAAIRAARYLMVAALVIPVVVPWLAEGSSWRPAPQIWSVLETSGPSAVVVPLEAAATRAANAANAIGEPASWMVVPAAVIVGTLTWAIAGWWSLLGLVRRSQAIEVQQGIDIRVSDDVGIPFAAWLPGHRTVVLDRETWEHPVDRQLALQHELQHHANEDTLFAYLHVFMRGLCVWHPFAHLWAAKLSELEEFAVDEVMVAREDVSPKAYGACLVRTARRVSLQEVPAYAVALTRRAKRSLLHRRLEALAAPTPRARRPGPLVAAGVALMAATSFAADGVLGEVGLPETTVAMLTRHAGQMDIPYPPQDVVQTSVDRIAGSPDKVRTLRRGIERSHRWLKGIVPELRKRRLPIELAAVPLVESGYRNLEPHPELDWHGAGLWMFDPDTARAYDLRVGDEVDDRLDPVLATEAAMRLFVDLYNEFDDWGLALAAYHEGRDTVYEAIAAEGTRDPWTLMQRGALEHYAADVLAAALVMDMPSVLDARIH